MAEGFHEQAADRGDISDRRVDLGQGFRDEIERAGIRLMGELVQVGGDAGLTKQRQRLGKRLPVFKRQA